MRCPFCQNEDSQVKDSRPTEDGAAIRRRRQCDRCGSRFTTFERVQLRDLIIIKKSGRRVPFEREKLTRSIEVALRKRPFEADAIEKLVSEIVRRLESLGEAEIPSEQVGELVLETLAKTDAVAYVRYASVYRDFRETGDFSRILKDPQLGRPRQKEKPPEPEGKPEDKPSGA